MPESERVVSSHSLPTPHLRWHEAWWWVRQREREREREIESKRDEDFNARPSPLFTSHSFVPLCWVYIYYVVCPRVFYSHLSVSLPIANGAIKLNDVARRPREKLMTVLTKARTERDTQRQREKEKIVSAKRYSRTPITYDRVKTKQ